MVYLKVIGSSSKGNCYILQTAKSNERLIIECGVKWTEIAKGLNFKYPSGVSGCLVSHEHGDHSFSIKEVLQNGIDVYALESVFIAKKIKYNKIPFATTITPNKWLKIGNFSVLPLEMEHDVSCLGFVIKHKELGSLLFATDTAKVPYKIKGLNHILIEANYSELILQQNLESGKVPMFLKKRLQNSHLEICETISTLKDMDLTKLQTLCLIHLSESNSDAELFKNKVEEELGIEPIIAKNGLEITLMNGDLR